MLHRLVQRGRLLYRFTCGLNAITWRGQVSAALLQATHCLSLQVPTPLLPKATTLYIPTALKVATNAALRLEVGEDATV
jgi:hypothetical protein